MKVFILTLFFSLLLATNLSASSGKIDERVTDIYYGNGILVTQSNAYFALNKIIQPAVQQDIYNGNEEEMKKNHNFLLAYNRTFKEAEIAGVSGKLGEVPGAILDIMETYEQLQNTSLGWKVFDATRSIITTIASGTPITKAVKKQIRDYLINEHVPQYIASFISVKLTADGLAQIKELSNIALSNIIDKSHDEDLDIMTDKYKESIRAGHGVIMVTHSQGNLFAIESVKKILLSDPWMEDYFYHVSIATPATKFATARHQQVSLDNDPINYLLTLSPVSSTHTNPARSYKLEAKTIYPNVLDREWYENPPITPNSPAGIWANGSKPNDDKITQDIYDPKLKITQNYLFDIKVIETLTNAEFHSFEYYMGKKALLAYYYDTNGLEIGSVVSTETREDILQGIKYGIKFHNIVDSQWKKSKNIGCANTCDSRIEVAHIHDPSLDANMSDIDVLSFDEQGKLYPIDGQYIKANGSGDSVESILDGSVCYNLLDGDSNTLGTINGQVPKQISGGGAVTVLLSWSEGENDFDLTLGMPSAIHERTCLKELAYVATEFEIFPGKYKVSVVYNGSSSPKSTPDMIYVNITTPDGSKVLQIDTNKSGMSPGHVADIIVRYVNNKPVYTLTPIGSSIAIYSYGYSSHHSSYTPIYGGSSGRYTPHITPSCSPAMSCGCKPCEYIIIPYISQALKGPLSGADIALYSLDGFRSNSAIYSGKTSVGNTLYSAGLLNIPLETISTLEDEKLYVFRVSGGIDIDPDDDMKIDSIGIPNLGVLHALATGAELKSIKPKVNILSEVAYQIVKDDIASKAPEEQIMLSLSDIASRLLTTKIYPESNASLGNIDLLQWLPTIDREILFTDYSDKVAPIGSKLLRGEDIYQDAFNLVYYPDGVLPILKSLKVSVEENITIGSTIAKVEIRSEGKSPVENMKIEGNGSESFNIDTNGTITLIKELDYEQKSFYNLYISAINTNGQGKSILVAVQIIDIADAPKITGFKGVQIYSSDPIDTPVGRILFDDNLAPVTSLHLKGIDEEYFSIDSKGNITVAKTLQSYWKKRGYIFSAIASNALGDSVSAKIRVSVSDGKIVPKLNPLDANISEDAIGGTLVGQLKLASNGESEVLGYKLSGYSSELFVVDANGTIKLKDNATLDHEVRSGHSFKAQAYNSYGYSKKVDIIITVTNVLDAPPSTNHARFAISENVPIGFEVGTLNFRAGEADVESITLSGIGSELFSVDLNGTVRTTGNIDYEKNDFFSFTYTVTTALGSSSSALQIKVNNIPEVAPILLDTLTVIHEHRSHIWAVNIKESGDTHITEAELNMKNPAISLTVSPSMPHLILSLDGSLDHNRTPELKLKVRAKNQKGWSEWVDLNITILEHNDGPTLQNMEFFVEEESVDIGEVIVVDSGDSDIISFELYEDQFLPLASSNFQISNTGYITSNRWLDYEGGKTSYTLWANAINSHGNSWVTDANTHSSITKRAKVVINITNLGDFYIDSAVYDDNRTSRVDDDKLHLYISQSINPETIASDMSLNYNTYGDGVIDASSASEYNDTLFHRHTIYLAGGSVGFKTSSDSISLAEGVITDNYEPDVAQSIDGSTPPIPIEKAKRVLETGQVISYTLADDADLAKGVTRAYERNSSTEIVTDISSALMWLDNNSSKMNHDSAIHYCNDLNLGGFTGWRLPSLYELSQLVDRGRVDPSIDPVFINIKSEEYWAEETVEFNYFSIGAYAVEFNLGSLSIYYSEESRCYTMCVRSTK